MTNNQLTRERIELIANFHRAMTLPPSHDEIEELARMALAALDSEPVAEVVSVFGDSESIGERELKLLVGIQKMPCGTKFYRHAQPAPDTEREPIAWLNDAYLARGVVDGEAGSEDAGPGYIPVYRESSPAQPAPVVPKSISVREAISALESADAVTTIGQAYKMGWNACRAAMLQARSLTGINPAPALVSFPKTGEVLTTNSPAQSDCSPAQNHVSPALNPIDHGYRPDCECSGCKATARICAELAGNSPVIPDGYVIVPKEPTEDMIVAAMNCDDVSFNSDESFCVQFGNIYEAMLAAAPPAPKQENI
ncbi:hypothetical protein ACK5EC_005185 [Klebsiella oxytoca]